MTSAAASGRSSLRSVKCRSPGPGPVQVHVRPVVGRRQRVDLGEQLGGGRQAGERRGDRPDGRVRGGGPLRAPPAAPSRGRRSHRPVVEHVFHGAGARPDRGCVGRALVLRVHDELAVQRAAPGQFLVRAAVGDPAVVQDHDPVGQVQRGPAVRDDQRGPAAHHLAQRGVDLRLQPRVDGRGGVVEDQQPRVGDQRPGQRHPLPLAAGKGQALLADHGVVALRQPVDELVRLGRPGRRQDLLVGGVGAAVGDVGPDGVGEQEAVLHDQADRGPQGVPGHVGDVVPADPDHAGLRVVEARQQLRQGGLAGAGRADHGDDLARCHVQRKTAKHRLVRYVAELDFVEAEPGRVRRQLDGVRLVGDDRPRVDDVEHPDDAGPRLLPERHHVGEHAHRARHLGQVGGERQERAERDRAVQGQPAAERQHADHAQRGDGGQRRVVPGGDPDHPQPGREQVLARRLEPLLLLLLLAEPLDHPHAADGLVDHAGHLAGLLLRVPAGREQLAPRRQRDDPQRGRDRDGHDRQHRREHHHDAEGQHEQHDVPERDRHHGHQALHHVQVGDGPADQLPGADLVLARAVQPGQRVEQLGAHVVLDVQGELPAPVAAQVDAAEVHRGRDEEQPGQRPDRRPPGHDHVVDDLPLHQRVSPRWRRSPPVSRPVPPAPSGGNASSSPPAASATRSQKPASQPFYLSSSTALPLVCADARRRINSRSFRFISLTNHLGLMA